MSHRKDVLWKGLLEWVCDDLLRFVFPNADEVFDLNRKFQFLDKELIQLSPQPDKKIDARVVDKLVQVYRKDGGEEWILIHIEVQDQTKAEDRPFFGERMFRYFYRCFDKHARPIAAIAIFCGPDAKKLPISYEYCFMSTRLRYEYATVCALDYTDEELRISRNPFAWVLLIVKQALQKGKAIDEKLLEGKLIVFRKLFENGIFDKPKLKAILTFLNNYVQFGEPETYCTFDVEVDKITGKNSTMYIFEQLAQQDAKEAIVRRMLTKTRLSVEKIADLVEVKVTVVKRLSKEVRGK